MTADSGRGQLSIYFFIKPYTLYIFYLIKVTKQYPKARFDLTIDSSSIVLHSMKCIVKEKYASEALCSK